jgi:dipeptidyl aminopeptidase/acylaminoacyl peptidase
VRFVGNRGRLALYSSDLDRGVDKLVDADMENANDWAVGADGRVLARSEYDPTSGRWTLKAHSDEGGWRPVKVVDGLAERPDLSGLGRDTTSVLVSQREGEKFTLRELAKGAATWGEPLTVENYGKILRDPGAHVLIGVAGAAGDEYRHRFFNPRDEKIWAAIVKAYPGASVRLVSWSADRKRSIVRVDSPTEGPAYALVDLDTRKASWIGQEYEGVREADIAPAEPIRFKAADGLDLSGYLTLPRGREAKNLPLVVFPHGGPASRDELGFDWWAQAMASRGYAVLQVNYRGSEGFGWSFLSAGFGEWGRKMQTDLSDGVSYLAGEGIIDPKRVCIVGASYGGYAALAGVTLQNGVYRCAASVSGPSDLGRMVRWSKRQSGVTAQRYWLRFMGAENVRDDVLDAISPAQLAERATVPVLLIHGRDDTVVPLEQSRIMAEALERADHAPELVVLKGDDHWLSRGATRLQMLRSVVAFLEKHNPPS